MKLDFLIIGAQKAGTTSLHAYLQKEADIEIPNKKELHFFDDEKINWINPNYEEYHKNFISDKLRGEITPYYMYDERCINRIKKYNPNMKLIIILRNPIERAFSQYKMSIAVNKKETKDFSFAIREGRNRIKNSEEANHVFSYVERGFYGKQLSFIYSRFPKEQVLILKLVDLELKPQETIQTIRTFLKLDISTMANFNKIHENKTLLQKMELKKEDYDYLSRLYENDDLLLKNLSGISFLH